MSLKDWLLDDAPESDLQAQLGRLYLGWLTLQRNPITLTGLIVIILLVLIAVLAPVLATHGPNDQNLETRLLAPGAGHWLGTDHLGRDIYSRLLFGSRLTLYIIIMVALISSPLGLIIGVVSGYFGGVVDTVLMRITDIFMAFPRLILALAFVAVLGPGVENAVVAIAITTWPPYARISRAETLTFRNSDFIHAARVQGASTVRILLGQIVPLCITSVIIRMTLDMAGVILTAAGLGFLGLGAQPPTAEWGTMIATGREYLVDYWWVAAAPGIAILIVSLGFNLLGDGLRDLLDPKQEG